jgi:hypothetical protein
VAVTYPGQAQPVDWESRRDCDGSLRIYTCRGHGRSYSRPITSDNLTQSQGNDAMTSFEFVFGMISVITSLALTRLLSG